MKPTQQLHDLGQRIWLDNITRNLLQTGTLKRYIETLSLTGLTSNPTIFDQAIKSSSAYDGAIRNRRAAGKAAEDLFFDLAIEDIGLAADLFDATHERTRGVDGWVSIEVSPRLAHDTRSTTAVAKELHARAGRRNVLIKIPGTPEGLPAIKEVVFAGVPVNVTLLFSVAQYLAAAEAYLRGVERRIAAGLNPDVGSVASVFISRWDVAVVDRVAAEQRNTLGIAIGRRCYKAFCRFIASPRYQRILNAGARPQRLLFASTGTKDPHRDKTRLARDRELKGATRSNAEAMKVLVIDVGGTHVKMLVTDATQPREFKSGPKLSAAKMVVKVKQLTADWNYDVVAIGYPGPLLHQRVAAEPHNLGKGWMGFDFGAAFARPVKLINDAAMQALGGYRGGRMLFLGFGTGLGSALIVDGIVEPMELGHLPYRKGTYEDYVGARARERIGNKKWSRHVVDVIARLCAALEPDEVLVGGGNASHIDELPQGCRRGDNADAFAGGFRLWADHEAPAVACAPCHPSDAASP